MFSNHFLFFFSEMKDNCLTGKHVEKRIPPTLLVGMSIGAAIMENRIKVP